MVGFRSESASDDVPESTALDPTHLREASE
jgi:hypothetical protein